MGTLSERQQQQSQSHQEELEQTAKRAIRMLPLYVVVPLLFWIGFHAAGYPMDWQAFGFGALGWTVALLLRGPISVLVMKLPQEKGKNIIVASSGVLEESVRLIVLALTSTAAGWAASVGQGWAAVEVAFTMVNVIVIVSLVNRTDEKAMQAKQWLAAQNTTHASPLWGILERIWASAFHIGSTLIVAFQPWAVVLLIPLHSGLNAIAVRLAARSVGRSSLFVGVTGIVVFLVGLAAILSLN